MIDKTVQSNRMESLQAAGCMDMDRLATICKALSHPARIHIVTHLKQLNRCICSELVDALPLAQSTVSQHLKILKRAGIIRGTIKGPTTCYCLDPAVIAEFKQLVENF